MKNGGKFTDSYLYQSKLDFILNYSLTQGFLPIYSPMTAHDKMIKIFYQEIAINKHCLYLLTDIRLSTVRNKLHLNNDTELIDCAIQMKRQHNQLQLLCFVSYVENKTLYTYYDFARNVQKRIYLFYSTVLIREHNGAQLEQLFVQFLCVYVKKDYQPDEIIQVVLNNTRQLYRKNYENQIQRNLTLIPPNAIMANGKMYCEMHPEEFEGLDMSENLVNKIKQALKDKGLSKINSNSSKTQTNNQIQTKQSPKTTKSNQNIQPPRINESKKHSIQQQSKQNELIEKNLQKKEKAKLPRKKLLIQSQSQQIYHPSQANQLFDLKPKIISSSVMELENQGNYIENQPKNNTHKHQKMEIEHLNLSHLNPKTSSPKQTQAHHDQNEEDFMDQFMNQMNNKPVINQHQNNKPSIGAKSMPSTKLTEFCSKFPEPAKSQSIKQVNQASLFDFFGKKKQ